MVWEGITNHVPCKMMLGSILKQKMWFDGHDVAFVPFAEISIGRNLLSSGRLSGLGSGMPRILHGCRRIRIAPNGDNRFYMQGGVDFLPRNRRFTAFGSGLGDTQDGEW